jgi:hypothetical protein
MFGCSPGYGVTEHFGCEFQRGVFVGRVAHTESKAHGFPIQAEVEEMPEIAKFVTQDYREAITRVRDTIAAVPALRDEEWSSLTKHVSELYVLAKFGYLRCASADSRVDGLIPLPNESEIHFDADDPVFLSNRGIQVKGCRVRKKHGTTGDVKLNSPFKYLYVVWLNETYEVMEHEVYRLDYSVVKELIVQKMIDKPGGKNTRKITWYEAKRLGIPVNPRPQITSDPPEAAAGESRPFRIK